MVCLCAGGQPSALAQEGLSGDFTEFETETPLFLAVWINGRDTRTVAEFLAHPASGRISARRSELIDIGINPPRGLNQRVFLDDIPGLSFTYDENSQSLSFKASDSALRPAVISASARRTHTSSEPGTGAVLNYALAFTHVNNAGTQIDSNLFTASLDGWIYSLFGRLGSTAIYRHSPIYGAQDNLIRLETSYEFNLESKALTFKVGDIVSSGNSWSRPIRMAGVQLRRDFDIRSDIVTDQLLSFSGAAAVPSTVDVFIDNNRAYSGRVESGPFRIEDVPYSAGKGDAVIEVKDAEGNVTRRRVSFFATRNLLKRGVADYSFEFGRARQAYAIESDSYASDTVYSGSFRYGLTKNLTVELHGEGTRDFHLASVGITTVPLSLAEVSLSAGVSAYSGKTARVVQGNLRTQFGGMDLSLSSLRAEEDFADLALVTGRDYLGAANLSGSLVEFPRALDVFSLSMPVRWADSTLGMSMVRSERATSEDRIFYTSFGRRLLQDRATLNFYGSHNMVTDESRLSLSLSMPLGGRRYANASLSRENDGRRIGRVYLDRPLSERVGDYGYSLELEDSDSNMLAGAMGEYRTSFGRGSVEVRRNASNLYAQARFNGSLVVSGGGMAAGNTINGGFAMVDVGVANVPVYLQNREVAQTNRNGRALITGLAANRQNRLSLNVESLPDDVTVDASAAQVIPARRGGALVKFGGRIGPSVVAILHDETGAFLPPGTVGRLNGGGDEIFVGYDGMALIEDIRPSNTLIMDLGGRSCTAQFEFSATGNIQDFIDPVVCQ